MTTTAGQRFSCSPTLPGRARAWLRATLPAALPSGAAVRAVLDDAEVVVSELTTNAVRARCSATKVEWEVDGPSVLVAVWDDGEGWPRPVSTPPDAHHGRGLQIVSALARQWGVHRQRYGKRTWALLNVSVM
jgi:anti-sigma regulatory factor (Ser/Thr protein kinase)